MNKLVKCRHDLPSELAALVNTRVGIITPSTAASNKGCICVGIPLKDSVKGFDIPYWVNHFRELQGKYNCLISSEMLWLHRKPASFTDIQ